MPRGLKEPSLASNSITKHRSKKTGLIPCFFASIPSGQRVDPMVYCFLWQTMLLLVMIFISKEQFLEEHNKLSPATLQATLTLLNRFREEKRPLMKDDCWCLEKLRIPFISWLSALPEPEKKYSRKSRKKEIFKNYPETHYAA